MAVTIFTHAQVLVSTSTSTDDSAALDISSFCKSVEFTRTYDIHDVTTFGQTDRQRRAGIAEWSFNTTLLQSFSTADALGGSGSLDALLNTLADVGQAGGTFTIFVRPKSNIAPLKGEFNPMYWGQCIMEEYSPMSGEVGDPLEMDVPFISAGSINRSVTSS